MEQMVWQQELRLWDDSLSGVVGGGGGFPSSEAFKAAATSPSLTAEADTQPMGGQDLRTQSFSFSTCCPSPVLLS